VERKVSENRPTHKYLGFSREQMLLKRFSYQRKRWTRLNPQATSRQPRKGQSWENVVKISCPSGSLQGRSRVEHFEPIGICIIFANCLKRSLANSCPEIGLYRAFENVIVPFQKMIVVAELTYSFGNFGARFRPGNLQGSVWDTLQILYIVQSSRNG
jgi:hypothetical protein